MIKIRYFRVAEGRAFNFPVGLIEGAKPRGLLGGAVVALEHRRIRGDRQFRGFQRMMTNAVNHGDLVELDEAAGKAAIAAQEAAKVAAPDTANEEHAS